MTRDDCTDDELMAIAVVVIEAFLSMPFEEMSVEQRQGAIVMADAILAPCVPLLPCKLPPQGWASMQQMHAAALKIRLSIGAVIT